MKLTVLRLALSLLASILVLLSPAQAQTANEALAQLPSSFFGAPKVAGEASATDRVTYHKATEPGYRVVTVKIVDQIRTLGPDELKFAAEDAVSAGKLLENQGGSLVVKSGFTSKKYPKAQGFFVEYFNPKYREWVQFWGLETGKLKYFVSATVSLDSERKAAKKAVADYFFPKAKFAGSLSGLK